MHKLISAIKSSTFYFPRNCDQSEDLIFLSQLYATVHAVLSFPLLQLSVLQCLNLPKQVIRDIAPFSIW